MGVNSSKGFNFRLMASGSMGYEQLDTFQDESIMVSNNVTGLFDLGILPSDFTRQITIPGTKKNNAFFQHVYDIAIENPYLFRTNVKVPAYFDFDGIYISEGYLQLNKVNLYANKFVESYEISIYGGLSSFGRDINRYYLTDLTSSLAQYNHTASYENISASWNGNLFNGDIVYPFIEYGQKIQYTPEENFFGIDSVEGALAVQDYKPAIRVKKVWDAVFEEFGYSYSSSFFEQPFLDNVYMVCNNNLRYPVYDNINLETYGLFKISPISGSGTDIVMSAGSDLFLNWYNINENPSNSIASNLSYTIGFETKLRGQLNLNFEVSSSGAGNGIPQFYLDIKDSSDVVQSTTALVNYNNYLTDVQIYNNTQTKTQKFELLTEFNTALLASGSYTFNLRYENQGGSNFKVTLNPDGSTKSYLQVTKVNQGGDGLVMNIAENMPYGTTGIKLIDFITSVQKKFNLVIYPNKTKNREFIVETFNNWYNRGQIRDFDKYINLNEKIEVVPANNLAVNQLNFGDTLDGDYVSQQFSKAVNREYGKSYYTDTENFFSQGTFEVKTKFASSPLLYLEGTGVSGSAQISTLQFKSTAEASTLGGGSLAAAVANIKLGTYYITQADATVTSAGQYRIESDPTTGYTSYTIESGDTITFESAGYVGVSNLSYEFKKLIGPSAITLASGTGQINFNYVVTSADLSSNAIFTCEVSCQA